MPFDQQDLDPAMTPAPDTEPTADRPLTFGERAVGLTFNPSKNPEVDRCKRIFAAAIDQMNDLRTATDDPAVKRHCSDAITKAEDAQMRAVRAITWA